MVYDKFVEHQSSNGLHNSSTVDDMRDSSIQNGALLLAIVWCIWSINIYEESNYL